MRGRVKGTPQNRKQTHSSRFIPVLCGDFQKRSTFVMFNAKEQYLLANFASSHFLCLLFRCAPICNDMGLSTHGGLLQVSCNLFFGENVRDSPSFYAKFIHYAKEQ